jgi:hypothetical protein
MEINIKINELRIVLFLYVGTEYRLTTQEKKTDWVGLKTGFPGENLVS